MQKHSLENPEELAPLAKRLRLSDPNTMTETTPDVKSDQEDSIENTNPKLFEYRTPLIYAFPTTLAVGEFAWFRYNCTPWLAERLNDLRLFWRIVDFAHPYRREGDKSTPIMRLGTTVYVHFYAVFPHLETIGRTAKCGVFKKWHDEVIRPAFEKTIYEQVPPTHERVLLHSKGIERAETPVSKALINILPLQLPFVIDDSNAMSLTHLRRHMQCSFESAAPPAYILTLTLTIF